MLIAYCLFSIASWTGLPEYRADLASEHQRQVDHCLQGRWWGKFTSTAAIVFVVASKFGRLVCMLRSNAPRDVSRAS